MLKPHPLVPAHFGLLILPYGIVTGYCGLALPRLLALQGTSTVAIAVFLALAMQPRAWKFFMEPAIDARWRRKYWYLASLALTLVSLFFAILAHAAKWDLFGVGALKLLGAVLFVTNIGASVLSGALHTLIATALPDEKKSSAAGWTMAGSIGGTGLGGAAALLILQNTPTILAAILITSLMALCAVPVFSIQEEDPPKGHIGQVLAGVLSDAWQTLKSTSGWTGLLICLSPVGAAGAMGLFTAVARDYHASDMQIAVVNGLLAGLVSAAGSLIGGAISGRMNARLTYILAGGLTGLVALGMARMPLTPTTYIAGCLAYSFVGGIAFAAWTAFVLTLMGRGSAVATKHALYAAAGNQATNYVVVLNGLAKDGRLLPAIVGTGPVGLLQMDALATAVGVVLLVAAYFGIRARRAA